MEAIGVINATPEIESVLVIAPASLKLNWRKECERWLSRPMRVAVVMPKDKTLPDAEIVVVNYDILDRHQEEIRERDWHLLVVDESHCLLNPKTKRTAQVLGRWSREPEERIEPIPATRRLFLSGSPLVNRPIELWSLLHSLDPTGLGKSWKAFVTRYCNGRQELVGYRNPTLVWNVSGSSNLPELQERLRATLMVRRLKREVLTELPPKQRQIIELPAEGFEHVIQAEVDAWTQWEDGLAELKAQVEIAKTSEDLTEYERAVVKLNEGARHAFTEIARVRHATAVAKVPLVIEHIREALESEDKVVCWIHHHDVEKAIAKEFGNECVVLTGETKIEARQAAVDRFQTDPTCRLFIGSITAAGLGITLTAASHAIFAELTFVPGEISQCEDRCLVAGQLVYCLQSVYDGRMSIKSIEDVKVGDMVLTHLGNRGKVTAINSHKHQGSFTSITYVGWGKPLICTHDHKLLVKRNGEVLWIEAHQVLPSDSMAFPKIKNFTRLDHVVIKPEWRMYENPIKPTKCIIEGCNKPIEARGMCRIHYRTVLAQTSRPAKPPQINPRHVRLPDKIQIDDDWLFLFGWYAAEGFSSIAKGKGRFLSFSGHERELLIFKKLGCAISSIGVNWTIYRKEESRGVEMRAYSIELARWFREWFGHEARNKKFPDVLMNLPPDQAEIVLRGYVAGDGYRRRGHQEWVSASKELCYQACLLAIRAGYIPTMRRGSKASGAHWVGGYTLEPRGNQRLQEQNSDYIFRPIRRVETYYDKQQVFDLTVEGDHSFVVGFASAHNCHRLGTVNPVLIQHLVLDGSLDARMAHILVEKQRVIDEALDKELPAREPVIPTASSGETVRREVIEKEAAELTADQIAAIHEALQRLSGVCDGARTLDGAGFNKVDARIGSDLALRGALTPRQAILGRKICIKYRRQLGDDLITRIKNGKGG